MAGAKELNIKGLSLNIKDGELRESIIPVKQDGVFIVDENFNIAASFTNNGVVIGGQSDISELYKILGLDESMENTYDGERISLRKEFKYHQEELFNLTNTSGGNGRQGAAIYGKWLFQCYDNTKVVQLYDLEKKSLHVAIKRSDDVTNINGNHAGTASFGGFYSSSDDFPLLYISSMGSAIGYSNELTDTPAHVFVYRVNGSYSIPNSLNLVQTITLPNYPNAPFLPDACIDPESNKLVVWGYTKKSRASGVVNSEKNHIQIMVFDLPDFSEGDVTLTTPIKEYKIPYHYGVQDGCIRNGMLYLVYGLYPDYEAGIIALDYSAGVVRTHISLDVGARFEPEGFDIYDDAFIMTTYSGATGKAYKLVF